MTASDRLIKLEEAKKRFGPGEAERTELLLNGLGRVKFRDPAELIRLHETLLFHRAYPKSEGGLQRAEELLASFSRRIAGIEMDPFEEPEVSGIAGTSFSAIFSYDVVRSLAARHRGEVAIDWDRYEFTDRVAGLWRRLFPLIEEDTLVEAHIPYREWLKAATNGENELDWLRRKIAELPVGDKEKAELYRTLEFPILWNLGDSAVPRTRMRLLGGESFYHDEPLIRRSAISLEEELNRAPIPRQRLTRREGRTLLDLVLDTSAMRFRELHGFTYGDAGRVSRAELGRGVEVYVCGVPPDRRLPLRAYHAAMIFKNGVPAGYFETLTLFERMEVGFNLYYTFREGETAWLLARLLCLFRQMLGVNCFTIDPYQLGHENEEGIQSGAFWFYRKLGFRPASPVLARLAQTEEHKIAANPQYRTSARTLRRLAEAPVVYEMPGTEMGAWARFHIRNAGLAVQANKRKARDAGGLQAVVAAIPDFKRWSAGEKRQLDDVIRAKSAPDEIEYVRTMQRHTRFREAILRLGTTGTERSSTRSQWPRRGRQS